jgi:hypothetical protein
MLAQKKNGRPSIMPYPVGEVRSTRKKHRIHKVRIPDARPVFYERGMVVVMVMVMVGEENNSEVAVRRPL